MCRSKREDLKFLVSSNIRAATDLFEIDTKQETATVTQPRP